MTKDEPLLMDVLDLTRHARSSTGVLFLHQLKDKGFVYRIDREDLEELTMRLIRLTHLRYFSALTALHTSKVFTDKSEAAEAMFNFIEQATGVRCRAEIMENE